MFLTEDKLASFDEWVSGFGSCVFLEPFELGIFDLLFGSFLGVREELAGTLFSVDDIVCCARREPEEFVFEFAHVVSVVDGVVDIAGFKLDLDTG